MHNTTEKYNSPSNLRHSKVFLDEFELLMAEMDIQNTTTFYGSGRFYTPNKHEEN
jgi:hypothetical protein